jgi:hypothetical protein
MTEHVCPGQDLRYWTPEDIFESACAHCGQPIEFFKNDPKRRCPSCGKFTLNPKKDLSCGDWCHSAEECIGTPQAENPDHRTTEK